MNGKETKDLDAKLEAAKAKKAAREKAGGVTQAVPGGATETGAAVPTKKTKEPTEQDLEIARLKAEKKAQTEAARKAKKEADEKAKAERKAAREQEKAAKAEKKAAEKASKKPHTAKLDRAAAKLPSLTDDEQLVVDDLLGNKGINIANIAAVLAFRSREAATAGSLGVKLEVGQTVKIVGGGGQGGVDPRYIGLIGTVDKVQRIRGYVNVEVGGSVKRIYAFLSELQPVAGESLESDDGEAETQAAAA